MSKVEFGLSFQSKNIEIPYEMEHKIQETDIREIIDLCFYTDGSINYKRLNLVGVELVKDIKNQKEETTCMTYLFGKISVLQMEQFFNEGNLCEIEPESVAFYVKNDEIVHVGWVNEDGKTITSKWGGEGNIFKHDPDRVLTDYGEKIFYCRPSNDAKVQIKENMEQVLKEN